MLARGRGFASWAAIACLLLMGCYPAARVPAERVAREWFSLTIAGQRVGYAYRERVSAGTEAIEREFFHVEVGARGTGGVIERQWEIARDRAGRLSRMAMSSQSGVARTSWQGVISQAEVGSSTIVRIDDGRATRTLALPAETLMPDRREASVAALLRGEMISLHAPALDVDHAVLSVFSAERMRQAAEHGAPVRIRTAVASDASQTEELRFDRAGRFLRGERPFLGATLVRTPCRSGCDSIDAPLDAMARMVVRSPHRIPEAAFAGPIRYVIRREDGARPELAVTGEQSVVFDGPRAVLTVCDRCGSAETPTLAELQHLRQPSRWIQSTDAEIRDMVRRAGRSEGRAEAQMPRLVEAVRERMTGDVTFLGYASAVEAARTRSGDCTEFAVLLAALARARGFPARIAVGLAYADRFSGKKHVFSPHAWAQVWNGERWLSYDAALDGFDATHIALAVGDGAPQAFERAFQQLPQLRIEKLGLVRTP